MTHSFLHEWLNHASFTFLSVYVHPSTVIWDVDTDVLEFVFKESKIKIPPSSTKIHKHKFQDKHPIPNT